jgi:hypothetical protein
VDTPRLSPRTDRTRRVPQGCATGGSALARQDARLTGRCDPSGFIGEGWRFGPNQYLFAERLAGVPAGNSAHSVALWVVLHNVTEGDVPLVALGAVWQPSFDAGGLAPAAPSGVWDYEAVLPGPAGEERVLGQPGTARAALGDAGVRGSHGPHGMGGRYATFRASERLCEETPRLTAPAAARAPQPALALGMQSADGGAFWYCTGLRLQAGVWYHLGWTYDGKAPGEARVYIDGQPSPPSPPSLLLPLPMSLLYTHSLPP